MAYPPRPNMAQEEPPASWRARRRKLGSVWFPSCSTTGTHAPRRVKAATREGHPAPWLAGELDPKGAQIEDASEVDLVVAVRREVDLLVAVRREVQP